MTRIKVGIADDHDLVREGIKMLVEDDRTQVVVEARSGRDLLDKVTYKQPEIVLMDINMPEVDGIAATSALKVSHPSIRVIALTALEDEANTIRMLRAGARAYLLKSASAIQLKKAITDVYQRGYHFSELVSGRLIQNLNNDFDHDETRLAIELTDREVEFIKLLCTELTNKEIADMMCVSPRTSEGWSKGLCERFGVKSRVGIVLFAFRNKLVN